MPYSEAFNPVNPEFSDSPEGDPHRHVETHVAAPLYELTDQQRVDIEKLLIHQLAMHKRFAGKEGIASSAVRRVILEIAEVAGAEISDADVLALESEVPQDMAVLHINTIIDNTLDLLNTRSIASRKNTIE